MQGNNTLELNEATVTEAIEYYLNAKVFKGRVKVASVKPIAGGYGQGLSVTLTEPESNEVGA